MELKKIVYMLNTKYYNYLFKVFRVLGLVPGYLDWLTSSKLDVKGDFVQTPMKGPPVFMKIESLLSKVYSGDVP